MTPPQEPVSPNRDQRKVGWGVATGCGIPTVTFLMMAALSTLGDAYGVAFIVVMAVLLAGLMMLGRPRTHDFGTGMAIGAVAITIIGFPVCVTAGGG